MIKCVTCKWSKTVDMFHVKKSGEIGVTCRLCKEKQDQRNEKKIERKLAEGTSQCTRCFSTKSLNQFKIKKSGEICKGCIPCNEKSNLVNRVRYGIINVDL